MDGRKKYKIYGGGQPIPVAGPNGTAATLSGTWVASSASTSTSASGGGGMLAGLAKAIFYPPPATPRPTAHTHASGQRRRMDAAGGTPAPPSSASASVPSLASRAASAAAVASPLPPPVPAAARSYDPHLNAFPLLPQYRGADDDRLLPPMHRKGTRKSRSRHSPHPSPTHSPPPVDGPRHHLSSLLNTSSFSSIDEVEPPPLYITPLPSAFHEATPAILALFRAYDARAGIVEEWQTFQANHHRAKEKNERGAGSEGVMEDIPSPTASDAVSDAFAARAYARCRSLVPGRYFDADFSVTEEALKFYEQTLQAAAAEAELEENEEKQREEEQKRNGTGSTSLLAPPSARKSAASSASTFYSTFGAPDAQSSSSSSMPSSSSSSAVAPSRTDSTYFQAAWAASHAPRYAPETMGIVPGMVGAALVTPAKAAASLYKLFNKLTGGPRVVSPSAVKVAASHQRSLKFGTRPRSGSGLTSSPTPPPTAEETNAMQLQQRLSSYLDVVELTLMQVVSAKSRSFFHSLAAIRSLHRQVEVALTSARSMRGSMAVMKKDMAEAGLNISATQRRLRNAQQLQAITHTLHSIAHTSATIKQLLADSDYGAAIQLIHSTLSMVKTPPFNRLRCLNQMELKMKESLKLIDMLMLNEFIALLIPPDGGPVTPQDALSHTPTLRAALRASAALTDDERERLAPLSLSLAQLGTLLPALLKYGQVVRTHMDEQINEFCKQEYERLCQENEKLAEIAAPQSQQTTSNTVAASSSSSAPSSSLHSSHSMHNLGSNTSAIPSHSSSSTVTSLSSSSSSSSSSSTSSATSFMKDMTAWVPNALRRGTGASATLSHPPQPAPIASAVSASASDEHAKAGDYTNVGSTLVVPATTSTSTSAPAPALSTDPQVHDAASQSILAALSHADFLMLQSRLHARVLAVLYRVLSVRDVVMEAITAETSTDDSSTLLSPATTTTTTPSTSSALPTARISREFSDLLKALIIQSKESSENGLVEHRLLKFLEPRQSAHAALTLPQLREVVECTMEFVREVETMSLSPCMELRRCMLAHEKAFLACLHGKLVAELTGSLEKDKWERADVPRYYQQLIDAACKNRPRGLPDAGGAGLDERMTHADTDQNGVTDGTTMDVVEEDVSVSTASFLFVDNEEASDNDAVSNDSTPSTSTSDLAASTGNRYSKYPVTSSVLTLLNLLSVYVTCAQQLKGVSLDILNRLVELLSLFNSRSVQLILGAGLLHFHPSLPSISSRQLALTSQCLSLLLSLLPRLERTLHTAFPAKCHAAVRREFGRVQKDMKDHHSELTKKMRQMAEEVCESACKGSVAWIRREEEINQRANAAKGTTIDGPTPTPAPAPADLPSLFKLLSRLISQTEALYVVVADTLQPHQRDALMTEISHSYVRIIHSYFNNSSNSSGSGSGSGGGSGIVANQFITLQTVRVKLAKRMEALLDKFSHWIPSDEFMRMQQQLSIYTTASLVHSAAKQTVSNVTTAQTTASVTDEQSQNDQQVLTKSETTPPATTITPSMSSTPSSSPPLSTTHSKQPSIDNTNANDADGSNGVSSMMADGSSTTAHDDTSESNANPVSATNKDVASADIATVSESDANPATSTPPRSSDTTVAAEADVASTACSPSSPRSSTSSLLPSASATPAPGPATQAAPVDEAVDQPGAVSTDAELP